ncbi:DNA-directed RNA polymerase I subunit 1 [Telopea speciosissima]|uniref:DNA-directed RNA polymerase I subunit 1 n=1 Tax=Telopea speciosissima TaxID=54955 RepID=UPI001CC343AD|nr:DNA-directed RNA polymerase I subunit 1 [Telopea speciosissima]
MAHTTEGATESVEAVHFSFYTDEEVTNLSVKKITNPILLDSVDRPVPDGLYDPALGPSDERTSCRSCGQRSFHCPGHCGHIDLVLPVYNPLLFNTLLDILRRACVFCHHFKITKEEVEKYATQLELIMKGDIVSAKELDLKNNIMLHVTSSEANNCNPKHWQGHKWTSLQYSEAMSVLSNFIKQKPKKCQNCTARNPTISSPTSGWIQTRMSDNNIRRNTLKGCKMSQTFSHGGEQKSVTGEVENANDLPPEFFKQKKFSGGLLLPSDVKDILKLLWENEARLCSLICDIQQESLHMSGKQASYSIFFIKDLLVPPIKFRPPSKGGDSVMEHPQTVLLGKVLQANISLGNAHLNSSEHSKIIPRWMDLQQSVNVLFDSKSVTGQKDNIATGICQLLEKKEGIFRQKMMGKRVNYACRSVISPDPYLAVNEIGIPPYFALRLTYPERVTPWNVNKLRNAVINGAEVHPGATHYADKLATVKLPPSRKMRISISRKLPSSRGAFTQVGKSLDYEFESKVVYRHLQDGDIVLVNRQPTLHKPSIMAHVVRVLKGEKTLRMHYANCSTYNADFDGDEMNVHFPQDEISRAEAYNIVNANKQYIVPTSGDPIRGLIQDHIISAVLLTKRDTFLTLDQYNQLLYSSGVSAAGPGLFNSKLGQKVSIINSEDEIQPVLPAIWKPKPLWTGKQVITAILNHLTRGQPPFTVEKTGRIPGEYFGSKSGEANLLIRENELVHGVIDKAQFGKYGLVHTMQEFYGSDTAGILLSTFSRLFTGFLQMYGFTCGVDDLLILQHYDMRRSRELEESEKIGEEVHYQFIGCKDQDKDPTELQMEIEKVIRSNGESAVARLDRMMSSALNKLTSKVNNMLFPAGLLKPFPRNCLSLMTTTGAKGGLVNFTQISSLLGQQELEGKRVPRMVSGKTLPCFPPWDCASRAGGFINDRFLTGLRPQEYYFHCMAGREGLVDTAVKTSRSGYLQRCLIKTLECLKVCYDHTVRDADGSVVQFNYGEDGVDAHKTSFITEFKALASNQRIIQERIGGELGSASLFRSNGYIKELPDALKAKAKDFISCLSEKEREGLRLMKQKDFMKLLKHKYLSSLAEPGEPVGVIAAQSVGEPSTQMTLNTFHFAGRGEMNVTLGIPRLQEILMRASEKIQTPVMTCPLQKGRTRDEAERLAAKFKKVSVADVIESMEVSVMPFAVKKHQISSIYKLKLKLYPPLIYPPYMDITVKDCMKTIKNKFLRELEDAIQNHLDMLSKISGIKNIMQTAQSTSAKEAGEDDLGSTSQEVEENNVGGGDADDDEDDDGGGEDLGVDAQKRKRQATDEMDYEDDMENDILHITEHDEGDPSTGFESEVDQVEAEEGNTTTGEIQVFDADDETPSKAGSVSKSKSSAKKEKSVIDGKNASSKRRKKDTDRAFHVEAKGLDVEVHFRFTNEPHILLAQVLFQLVTQRHNAWFNSD